MGLTVAYPSELHAELRQGQQSLSQSPQRSSRLRLTAEIDLRQPAGRQNGAAIRAFRKKEGFTVAQLAERAGLQHQQSLVNIENDTRPASVGVIRAVARVLDVPVEAIVRGSV